MHIIHKIYYIKYIPIFSFKLTFDLLLFAPDTLPKNPLFLERDDFD